MDIHVSTSTFKDYLYCGKIIIRLKTKNKKGMQEAAVNHEFKKQQLHCKNEHWDQSLTQDYHSHW